MVTSAPRMLVVLPTHSHHSTLPWSVRSALEQTVAEIEVVIIGDGATDATRSAALELAASDPRVRFIDLPKGESRNEVGRHEVVSATAAPAVTYLGDDDLLLPHHVESMLQLLEDHDFAHPYPVVFDGEGKPFILPIDLDNQEWRSWTKQQGKNSISLTGAAHTMDLYRRLPHGWRVPPPGMWSDQAMWQQVFDVPGVRLATGTRATTIKLAEDRRSGASAEKREVEIRGHWEAMQQLSFTLEWDQRVEGLIQRAAADHRLRVDELTELMQMKDAELVDATAALQTTTEELAVAAAALEATRDELHAFRTRGLRARLGEIRRREWRTAD